ADDAAVSPDGARVAYVEGGLVHVRALEGEVPSPVPTGAGDVPVVSPEGGLFPRWRDARTLEFVSGATLYRHDVAGSRTTSQPLLAQPPRRTGRGRLAFTNARVIPMDAGPVLDRARVGVDGGRIACVGRCDTTGAGRTVDLDGAVLMPGIVDTHAHRHVLHQGIVPPHNFEAAVYLAYGITSTIDPA